MDVYAQMVENIIKQQEEIIGPVAVEQAKQVSTLKVDWPQHKVSVSGDPQTAVDQLVEKYEDLFGPIAVETCKDAAHKLLTQLPAEKQPHSLQ